MLIGWSPHQASDDPRQPAAYLLDNAVLKSVGSRPVWEVRTPAPELLLGHPSIVQAAIAALRFQRTTRVATLSFECFDIDVARFNAGDEAARRSIAGAIDLFFELAFAGVPEACRPPVCVGTHTHTGRLEVNIAMPRFVRAATGTLRSFNPHPPLRGSRNAFDALGDYLNAQFGWANPRAPARALAVKGPDWAEKRVAAAVRHGVKFTPDATPKLFALQAAKMIATSRHGAERSGFLDIFQDVVAATDYELRRGPGDAIALVSETDPYPFVLRGTCLARDEAISADPVQPASLETVLSDCWRRRAAWNASEYSSGAWAEPEPDWAHRIKTPKVTLPSCHPEASRPVPGPHRFASLAHRLGTALRHLRARLGRAVAARSVCACLGMIDLTLFRDITNKLERMNDDTAVPQIKRPGHLDGGALRSASPRLGQPPRGGRGERDKVVGLGDDRHSVGDGAAHRGLGAGGNCDESYPARDSRAAGPARGGGSNLPGYFLDQGAARPKRLRAVDVIRAMSAAVDEVLPRQERKVGMDHQGGYRLAGLGWEIAISRGGQVAGVGRLSAERYDLFVERLSDRLGVPAEESVLHDKNSVDYGPG